MENNDYIKNVNYGNVNVVENKKHQWAVIDNEGYVIVPFGKYGWIDGFDSGLARVHTNGNTGRKTDVNAIDFLNYKKSKRVDEVISFKEFIRIDRKKNPNKYAKWGIINENGEEVLPVIYDDVWNFYGKDLSSTKVEKDGKLFRVHFCNLNPSQLDIRNDSYSNYDYDSYGSHYGEFAGSYAQDVMGYSDDVINDAFEGDPDAYWNID